MNDARSKLLTLFREESEERLDRIVDGLLSVETGSATGDTINDYVYEALRAGASGFLLKDTQADQLMTGVRVVAQGDSLLAPSITRRLIEQFARRPPPSARPDALADLTRREHEILRLVARGLSNGEIAAELVLGEATVKTHVARILRKLDLRDGVQAVVAAYETGIVQPGGS